MKLIMVNLLATNATIVALVLKKQNNILRDYAFLTHKTLAFVAL